MTVKSKIFKDLKWSCWNDHTFTSDKFSYFHDFRGSTNIYNHKVEIWKFKANGQIKYEAYVMLGAYGETCYLRDIYTSAKLARLDAEKALRYAIEQGDAVI